MAVITCPHCGAAGNAPDQILGQTVRCSKCKQSFVAGGSPGVTAPPPVPHSAPSAAPAVVEDYEDVAPARRGGRGDDYEQDYDAPRRTRRGVGGSSALVDYVMFRRMIAPWVIMGVFYVGLVFVIIGALIAMVMGLVQGQFLGVLYGFIMLFIGPLGLRLYAELLLVIFRINETLTDIRNMKEARD